MSKDNLIDFVDRPVGSRSRSKYATLIGKIHETADNGKAVAVLFEGAPVAPSLVCHMPDGYRLRTMLTVDREHRIYWLEKKAEKKEQTHEQRD